MVSWIVGSSLKARRAVAAIGVLVMLIGLLKLGDSHVDSLPEFQPVSVRVQTEALGLSAEEVEQLITVPLEQDLLAGVAWVDTIRSRSVPGLSYIDIEFEDGTDLYRARQVVQERLSQAAALPNVSKPPQMIQPTASSSRVAMISLSSKTLSPVEVGVLTRWTMLPRLLSVPGVSNVAVWGQRERQIQVQIDPVKLRENDVSIEQVLNTAGNALWSSPLTFLEASTPGSGGFIETAQQRIGVQHVLPIVGPDDMAVLPIEPTEDAASPTLTLGDVAKIVEDHQPLIGDAVIGSNAESFVVVVEKFPNVNTSEVTQRVEAAVGELRPALTGVDITSDNFRPADYVERSVDNLRTTALIGLVLLVLALALLVFNWRAAVVCLVSVLLVFSLTTIVMRVLDQTLDMVTLAGLLLVTGAVVDDAIRNVDRLKRRLASGSDSTRASMLLSAARSSVVSTMWVLVMSLLVLVPLLIVNGLNGDSFFPPMARTAALALVISTIVAATVTPALAMILLSHADPAVGIGSPITRAIAGALSGIGSALGRLSVVGIAASVVAIVLGVILVPSSDKSLFPRFVDPHLVVEFQGAFGTSLPEMNRITSRAVAEVKTIPGVRKVVAHIGQASAGDAPVGTESAQLWVTLDPDSDFGNAMTKVRSVVTGYPGIDGKVSSYTRNRITRALTPPNAEVTVRVYGQDLKVLQEKGAELKRLLTGVDGVKRADIATPLAEPTIEIEVDLVRAQKLGVLPGDVRRVAAVLLAGIQVGSVYENQKVFEVSVWSIPEARNGVSSVKALPVPLPEGGFTTIGEVADVRIRPISPAIVHEDVTRYLDVAVQVDGRSVGDVESDAQAAIDSLKYPLEYHAEILDAYGDEQHSIRRMWIFAIAALIGLFLLIQSAFNSWRMALLVTLSLPVALLGGLIAAKIDGGPLTLATVAGMVGVLIVALRQAINLGSRYQGLRSDGVPFGSELSVGGMREFAPSAVASALTTIVLMIPLAFQGSSSGREVLSRAAAVIIGGSITSLLWALWILPALHRSFGPKADPISLDFDAEWEAAELDLEFAGSYARQTNQAQPEQEGPPA